MFTCMIIKLTVYLYHVLLCILTFNSFANFDLLLLHQIHPSNNHQVTINITYDILTLFFIFLNNVVCIVDFINISLGIDQRTTIFSIFNVDSIVKVVSFFTSFYFTAVFLIFNVITCISRVFIWCYICLGIFLFTSFWINVLQIFSPSFNAGCLHQITKCGQDYCTRFQITVLCWYLPVNFTLNQSFDWLIHFSWYNETCASVVSLSLS